MIDTNATEFISYSFLYDAQIIIDGQISANTATTWNVFQFTHPSSPRFNPSFTELVFVHSREEAQGFNDNVIVVWPAEGQATERRIELLNKFASHTAEELGNPSRWGRHPINIEDFGLTYPITIVDLVDNWEGILGVWNVLTDSERSSVRGS